MAFTFAAFCYILALILTAFLIFFAVWQVSYVVLEDYTCTTKLCSVNEYAHNRIV